MFKRSPKNCFKPLLPFSGQTTANRGDNIDLVAPASHSSTSTSTESSKSNIVNGPVLSYFNYFLLPQIDINVCENGEL